MPGLTKQEYVDWYIGRYGHRPEEYLIEKYYPDTEKEIEVEPVPEEFWRGNPLNG